MSSDSNVSISELKISEESIASWEQAQLHEAILSYLNQNGMQNPTAVQGLSIPILSQNQDALIVAETGSGKTLAYLLPILKKILITNNKTVNKQNQSRMLILVPTREVAEQIYNLVVAITEALSISACLVVGGMPDKQQVSQLNKKPQVIVATPGRLNDHLRHNKLLLQNVQTLIIDEADRMLTMGFINQVEQIIKTMRGEWQTIMVSASFAKDLKKTASRFLRKNSYLIKTKQADQPVSQLKQKIYFLNSNQKNDFVLSDLKNRKGKVIIFVTNHITCEELGPHLKNNGVSCDWVRGEYTSGHRARVLREFREGRIQVMITTDMLARGLDVEDVSCVINYELPLQSEDFLHRIGRTARAGKNGLAITLVAPYQLELFESLKQYTSGAVEVRL